MWIIPKTLSHFVPDPEGLSLALDEQAGMLEQSVTLRSKHSAAPTWQRRLKKVVPQTAELAWKTLWKELNEKR